MLSQAEIPQGPVVRTQWASLPKAVRREVIKQARRGQAWEDRHVAALAVGWAWEVLGSPDQRRRVSVVDRLVFLIEAAMTASGGVSTVGVDVFDGSPRHDDNPYVQRIARRVEAANLTPPT